MENITQKEVDELKQYLWGKINELENENRLLKVVIKIGIIITIALVMATQYALFGSII